MMNKLTIVNWSQSTMLHLGGRNLFVPPPRNRFLHLLLKKFFRISEDHHHLFHWESLCYLGFFTPKKTPSLQYSVFGLFKLKAHTFSLQLGIHGWWRLVKLDNNVSVSKCCFYLSVKSYGHLLQLVLHYYTMQLA